MMKDTIPQRIKSFIASLAWRMFVWSNNSSEEEYWEMIYNQEKNKREEE